MSSTGQTDDTSDASQMRAPDLIPPLEVTSASEVESASDAQAAQRIADEEEPAAPPPMGQNAARGVSVIIGFSLMSKVLTMLGQIVLAHFLSQADFGLYSTVLAVSSFGLAMRDGGATEWIIQRGRTQFNSWIGPAFWMALTFNVGVAILLTALAPLIASRTGSTTLAWMIVLSGIAQVLGTVGTTLTAKLRCELKFASTARISGISAMIRPVVSSGGAAGGLGALSFVLPLILCSIYESIRAWMFTRVSPWLRKPEFGRWATILRDSRWIMLNNGASALTNVGDYAVIAFILSADQRGVYLFAYQLVVQSALLLAANVTQVMFPTLAALKDDPPRFQAALLRTLRALMLVTAPATIGTGVVMAPVEDLIFKGRWDDAVWVVIVCSVLFPPRAIIPLSLSSLMARAKFRENSVITIAVGAGMMIGAAIGGIAAVAFDMAWSGRMLGTMGIAGGSFEGAVTREIFFAGFSSGAIGATLGCGVLRAIASTWGILWAAKLAGVRRRDTLDAIAGSWMLSTIAMVPTLALDLLVLREVHPIIRIFVAMSLYSAVWLVLTRLLLARDLRDLLTALPARIRLLGLKLLLMKDSA